MAQIEKMMDEIKGMTVLELNELVKALEDEFGVQIPDEEAENIGTVGQAVDLVANKLAG